MTVIGAQKVQYSNIWITSLFLNVVATRENLELASDHVALVIFDVFAAHRCDSKLKKLHEHHIHQDFVLASCTGELQPLDLTSNDEFKHLMKSHFSQRYASDITNALSSGQSM